MIARLLKLGSWAAIGIGALGVLGWAFSVRSLSDIGPLSSLLAIWLGIFGLMKASSLRSEAEARAQERRSS